MENLEELPHDSVHYFLWYQYVHLKILLNDESNISLHSEENKKEIKETLK